MTSRITVSHPLSRLVYFAPLLTTSFVLFTFTTFYRSFLQCSPGYKCDLINLESVFQGIRPDFATSAEGYVLRVNWTLAGGLHLVVSLAALLVSGIIIYQALHHHGVRSRLMLILVTLFVAADIGLYVAILTASDVNSPAQMLLERTVAQVLPHINFYNRLFDALGMMVGATLAVAACTIIWRNTDEAQDEKELIRRSRLLRVLLYAGAAALIVGVFRLGASLNWGKDFWVAGSPAGKDASTLVTGIISSLGISYTLILGSVYVPTMIMLRARAEALAKVESPDEQEEWLKKHGLTLSYIAYVPRILAILGPIIAGPIGKFLSDLIESKPA
ncbi:MAG: hypothetical protein LC803_12975 [Acidobacteria bacterium]|nr:hypothetical protein [Acidobacteriota bacterium]